MEAQEFLDLHTTFTDRTTKDIVDKVRTIIWRNKWLTDFASNTALPAPIVIHIAVISP